MASDRHLQSQQDNVITELRELIARTEPVVSVAEQERLDREIDSLALAARNFGVPWDRLAFVLHITEDEAVERYTEQARPPVTRMADSPPAPLFFIPRATPEEAERLLRTLAELADRPVPPADRRIYRTTWMHDGQRWTAEVGSRLRGVRVVKTSRGRAGQRLTDRATVLAIFEGVVVTDARPGKVASEWANPFFTGEPESTDYFRVDVGVKT
jgi:hypothetical protein